PSSSHLLPRRQCSRFESSNSPGSRFSRGSRGIEPTHRLSFRIVADELFGTGSETTSRRQTRSMSEYPTRKNASINEVIYNTSLDGMLRCFTAGMNFAIFGIFKYLT